jgi:tetratricopeptide (TPR) repeat protein
MVFPVFAFLLVPFTARAQTRQPTPSDFKALAAQAAAASEQDRIEDAIALYTRALALRPKWAEGWLSLGTLQYDQDRYAQAAQDFEKVIALDAANGAAHAMLGLCQFELGQDKAALKNLLTGQKLGVQKDQQLRNVVLYHLAVLQLRAQKYRVAKETLGHLAEDGVKTKELITALGLAALLVRPQVAPPEDTPGAGVIERAGEAEALLATKDFEQAKQRYAQLASEFPDYPNLHLAFGRLLIETNETDEAIEEFQRELKRDPRNVNSLLEIAAARYLVDSQDGLQYAEEAVKLAPGQPFAHYLLGLLLLDTGNAVGAIPEVEIAQKAFPREATVYFSLGNAYARAGRKADAARARETFMRINAQREKKSHDTVYDEYPRGLTQEKLGAEPEKNPPEL